MEESEYSDYASGAKTEKPQRVRAAQTIDIEQIEDSAVSVSRSKEFDSSSIYSKLVLAFATLGFCLATISISYLFLRYDAVYENWRQDVLGTGGDFGLSLILTAVFPQILAIFVGLVVAFYCLILLRRQADREVGLRAMSAANDLEGLARFGEKTLSAEDYNSVGSTETKQINRSMIRINAAGVWVITRHQEGDVVLAIPENEASPDKIADRFGDLTDKLHVLRSTTGTLRRPDTTPLEPETAPKGSDVA